MRRRRDHEKQPRQKGEDRIPRPRETAFCVQRHDD
jgi:hypothetical protein